MNKIKKIFIVTGTSASGKSGVAKFIFRNYPKVFIINVGDILADIVKFRTQDKSQRFRIGEKFLENHKIEEIFAYIRGEINHAEKLGYKRVVIDGPRFLRTITQIKEEYSNVLHLHVVARADRVKMRRMLRGSDMTGLQEECLANPFDLNSQQLAPHADMIVSTTKGRAAHISGKPQVGMVSIQDIDLETY